MSKKAGSGSGASGWRYTCSCGYETQQIAGAVTHLNKNKDHQLSRQEL